MSVCGWAGVGACVKLWVRVPVGVGVTCVHARGWAGVSACLYMCAGVGACVNLWVRVPVGVGVHV